MPERRTDIIGWDVGGAQLKAARVDPAGRVLAVWQLACPLWQGLHKLEAACLAVLEDLPPAPQHHAVTMSGEMADLFPDRASGVVAIVEFLRGLFARRRPDDALDVYAGPTGFLAPGDVAVETAHSIASANWLATAARCAASSEAGLLVDIGSTTSDLIPFSHGLIRAIGLDDRGRLAQGELVYAGIVRTPLMGLAQRAPFAGAWRGTMQEYFATTADVFRVLGELDESVDTQPAADGGPKNSEGSARRLLRMVGEDLPDCPPQHVLQLARWYRQRLLAMIADGLEQRLSRCDLPPDAPLVGAGIGRFLVAELAARSTRPYRDIDTLLCGQGEDASLRSAAAHCAPAVAVAQLRALALR